MKKIITICAALIMTASVFLPQQASAQAPKKMSYQAVVRDGSDALVTSTAVGMQISILQGTSAGTAVYVETQTPTSNANGLVSLEIGSGTTSDDFSTIDWSDGPYFIKTETDPTGGTNYTITGTSQLISVPYALFSSNGVTNGTAAGEMLYWNGTAWVVVAATVNEYAALQMIGGVPTWTGGTPPPPPPTSVTNPTTGKVWMDRNLGASQVATSSTDAAAYGDLYQWGRGTDGHQIRTSGTTPTLSTTDTPGNGNFILAPNSPNDWRSPQNDNLWQGVDGTNNPCPSTYRLPTVTELGAERASWSSNNAAGAFASPLRLPMAGFRGYSSGSLDDVGTIGDYWSSTVSGSSSRNLYFVSSNAATGGNIQAHGASVRCLKD